MVCPIIVQVQLFTLFHSYQELACPAQDFAPIHRFKAPAHLVATVQVQRRIPAEINPKRKGRFCLVLKGHPQEDSPW